MPTFRVSALQKNVYFQFTFTSQHTTSMLRQAKEWTIDTMHMCTDNVATKQYTAVVRNGNKKWTGTEDSDAHKQTYVHRHCRRSEPNACQC